MQNLRLIDFGFFVEVDSYHLEPIKVQYFAQLMYHEVKLAVDFLACVAGRRRGGRSKCAREAEGIVSPTAILPCFARSCLPFPFPLEACQACSQFPNNN